METNLKTAISYLKTERNKHTEAHQGHYDVAIQALEEKAERAKKPLTNLDKIKEMNVSAFAKFVYKGLENLCKTCNGCPEFVAGTPYMTCINRYVKWLESEVTDG
jgi:hypothetical protein